MMVSALSGLSDTIPTFAPAIFSMAEMYLDFTHQVYITGKDDYHIHVMSIHLKSNMFTF